MKHNKDARLAADVFIALTLVVILTYIAVPKFGGACDMGGTKPHNIGTNPQPVGTQFEPEKLYKNKTYPSNVIDGAVDGSDAYGPYMHEFPPNPFIDEPAEAVRGQGRWSYDSVPGVGSANATGHEGL